MKSPRWTRLALVLCVAAGCGPGASDASKEPSAAPLIRQRTERIDRYKEQAAKSARRPGS